MNNGRQQYYLDVLSGRQRGAAAAALRAFMAVIEPGYAALMRGRNLLYDHGLLPVRRLPRPAISVGNLTTGGTGKTPLVGWLAAAMQAQGQRPAVLLRGYKSRDGMSDEAALIAQAGRDVPVVADANRRRAAARALVDHPRVNLFILDDAMQHRRVARDMEIVLISAVEPWGYGHVLPRGLLREPISGLLRADAVVLTHTSEVEPKRIAEIEAQIRRHQPHAPIFHADHVLTGFNPQQSLAALAGEAYWAACGIGQPQSFLAALAQTGGRCAGSTVYADHHHFTPQDAAELQQQAHAAGATVIVVTEKDWTKLRSLPGIQESAVPFWRAKLEIRFAADDGNQLLDLIAQRSERDE